MARLRPHSPPQMQAHAVSNAGSQVQANSSGGIVARAVTTIT